MSRTVSKLAFGVFILAALATQVAVSAAPEEPHAASEQETSPHWDTAPKFKRARGLPPLYPMSYIRENKPGWAVVTYTVGVDGKASSVLLESASDAKFGKHVAAAIRVWPHHPAQKYGVPVEATVTRKFSLEFE